MHMIQLILAINYSPKNFYFTGVKCNMEPRKEISNGNNNIYEILESIAMTQNDALFFVADIHRSN